MLIIFRTGTEGFPQTRVNKEMLGEFETVLAHPLLDFVNATLKSPLSTSNRASTNTQSKIINKQGTFGTLATEGFFSNFGYVVYLDIEQSRG